MAASAGSIIVPPRLDYYGKCPNRYDDCVQKQTAYVPIPDPCVTYCNMFIFQIKKIGILLSD
jgi:hypothetical protein